MNTNIVVGIDFSKGSINALKFAIRLANAFDATVTMIWVDKPYNPDSVFEEEKDLRDEVHNRFEDLIEEMSSIIDRKRIAYKIRSGKVFSEVSAYAKLNNSLCIVAGTHGISGFEELWVGSNANKIVSTAPCPVITIRQDYKVPENLKKIVLPIDSTPGTIIKSAFAVKMAQKAEAEIIMVRLYSNNISALKRSVDANAEKVLDDMKKAGVKFSDIARNTDNLTSDLLDVIDKLNADVLVIMTEQDNAAANVMLGHSAQQIVNNSPIPILSIHNSDNCL